MGQTFHPCDIRTKIYGPFSGVIRARRNEHVANLFDSHVTSPMDSKNSCFYIFYIDRLMCEKFERLAFM